LAEHPQQGAFLAQLDCILAIAGEQVGNRDSNVGAVSGSYNINVNADVDDAGANDASTSS